MSELFNLEKIPRPPLRRRKAAPPDPEPREIGFELPCDPSALAVARRGMDALLDGGGYSDVQRADLQLALGEAVANAIRHGCPRGKPGSEIQVRIARVADGVVVAVTDPGPGFDASILPEPDVTLLQEGGMGVFLMRSVMDSVTYHHGDGGNTVTMVKKR